MMAMSSQFGHPGGMPGHGGMPHGHPMAPGHPSNQGVPNGGQPGVTMGQQMHAMGSGPQVTQGPMMGISQGGPGVSGGPSAHAMQHLNPAINPQLIQNQQQMHAGAALQQNPQLMQQHAYAQQQQHMMRQRVLMQQQHQQQNNGMMMNPNAPGFNMNQMRPGGPPGVHLPVHLQHAMQQNQHQQIIHQQQQAAQQVAVQQHQQQLLFQQQQQAQAQAQAQQAQQQERQQQQQQQQQHQAQHQHPVSQAAAVQGQQASQPPMRPPSTIQAGQDPQVAAAAVAAQAQQQAQAQAQSQAQQTQAQSQPQGQAQSQMAPQSTPQQAQAQANSQQATQPPQSQGTPQPQQTPQQTSQAQPQSTPQQPSQAQPQQQQASDVAAQQAQRQAQMQAAQAQAQAQALQQNALMARMRPMTDGSILRIHQFGENLGQGGSNAQPRPLHEIQYWKSFVSKFFSDSGVLRQQFSSTDGKGGKKVYELSISALPRYYWTHYNHGVQNIQMIMAGATGKELGASGHFVESSRLSFIYWYTNGTQVVTTGNLKAQLNQQGKIEMLELGVSEHNEYVQRSKITNLPDSPEIKHSPNISKTNNKKAAAQQRSKQQASDQARLSIPKAPLSNYCIPPSVLQVLEIAETFSQLDALFEFSRNNPQISGPEALRQLVASYQSNAQNTALAAEQAGVFNSGLGQQPPGQRTPGPGFVNGPQQFASPAPGAHLNLPTTASPANMNMSPAMAARALQQGGGSVGMVAQASQQGAGGNSQGVSANTSPNANNKRRRTSVKAEPDGDGPPEVNGTKVKQSPRVGKRQKPQ